jgi:hypothetical protein
VHGVFTRIRSGAKVVVSGGGVLGSTLSSTAAECTGSGFLARSAGTGCKCVGVKNPKGFGLYL